MQKTRWYANTWTQVHFKFLYSFFIHKLNCDRAKPISRRSLLPQNSAWHLWAQTANSEKSCMHTPHWFIPYFLNNVVPSSLGKFCLYSTVLYKCQKLVENKCPRLSLELLLLYIQVVFANQDAWMNPRAQTWNIEVLCWDLGYFAPLIITDIAVPRLATAEYRRICSAISDVQNLSMVNCTITLDQRDLADQSRPLIDGDFNLILEMKKTTFSPFI